MRTKRDGDKSRTLILEALLELPLGASLRDVAARVGRHVNTVDHHVKRLRKTGQVMVVKRGYKKRRVVVPVRMRLSEVEAQWLRLGVTTARVIVVVAKANGKRVSSREVADTLRWHHAVARHHLQRARNAGILEARHGVGYTLALGSDADREFAGLNVKALEVVEYIHRQARRVSSREIMEAFDLSERSAKWLLRRATRAGLLTSHIGKHGGYNISHGANRINWQKSELFHA